MCCPGTTSRSVETGNWSKPMSAASRRRLTLLDAILLVAAAAIGMGLFQLSRREMFKGWIWIADQGIPDVQTWSTTQVLITCSDLVVYLIPIVAPWTFLLILLEMREPRPSWRLIWRRPGPAACLAAVFGWMWSFVPLLLAMNVGYVARSRRNIVPEEWAQQYLNEEVFMYVGLAVAATWFIQYVSGR